MTGAGGGEAPRGVALLGATGSIGASALRVLARQPRWRPVALTANANREALRAQVATWAPAFVGLVSTDGAGNAASGDDAWACGPECLVAAATRPDESDLTDVRPLDGELSSGGNPLDLLHLMLSTSRGDMLWLRPDAWAMPRESRVSELLAEAMEPGSVAGVVVWENRWAAPFAAAARRAGTVLTAMLGESHAQRETGTTAGLETVRA